MKKIVVLFSGEGSNLSYLLQQLHKKKLEIAAAITNNPEAGGIAIAREYGVPVEIVDHRDFADRDTFDRELVKRIENYSPDLTVLAGFMRILTPLFAESVRAINLHPSLLPRHRGLDAIRRSWEDEQPEGGVTVHWVSAELDGGEMILQYELEKEGFESYEEYHDAIRRIEKEALAEAICDVLKCD
ncbi:phosphoribosylglycinamide formyltransferase [Nitratifractor sp.]|uniref:phosphoribosylglycinamide formyltransferase n=1 Tax=Nitratifractor sp. TaxID=2268144 RepID=UPI0025DF7AA5|nr:phosphoribosylglycinamide formyltransferase [Nitratifractor sp.]